MVTQGEEPPGRKGGSAQRCQSPRAHYLCASHSTEPTAQSRAGRRQLIPPPPPSQPAFQARSTTCHESITNHREGLPVKRGLDQGPAGWEGIGSRQKGAGHPREGSGRGCGRAGRRGRRSSERKKAKGGQEVLMGREVEWWLGAMSVIRGMKHGWEERENWTGTRRSP